MDEDIHINLYVQRYKVSLANTKNWKLNNVLYISLQRMLLKFRILRWMINNFSLICFWVKYFILWWKYQLYVDKLQEITDTIIIAKNP